MGGRKPMKRKLCSLCLTAAIVLSLCPASVRAETEKLKAVQEMEISQETEESEEVGAADLDSWNSEEELMVFGLSDLDLEEDGRLRLASVYDWDGMVQNTVNWMRGSGAQVMNSTFLQKVSSTSTDWYAFCLGRLGVSDNYSGFLAAADSYVRKKYTQDPSNGLSTNTATEWHRLTAAVLAAGGDPTAVGGQNLIADGVYNCLAGEPWEQGINGAIWALLSVDTKGYPIPEGAKYSREDLIQYILENQVKSGGWTLSGNIADADITGMAIQALAPYYTGDEAVKAAVDQGLTFLRNGISADGDLESGGDYNCESTAQAIVAFAAMGIDPSSVTSSGGRSLMDGLAKYYNTSTGGFLHKSTNRTSNALATGQAMYAIAAYRYYQQGLSLYDFRDTANTAQYVARADGAVYTAAAGADAALFVGEGANTITFENVPVGNYDAAEVTADGKTYVSSYRRSDGSTPVEGNIPVEEGTVLGITVKHQDGTSEEWTLTVHTDAKAEVKALIRQIDGLPDAADLTLEQKDAVAAAKEAFEKLSLGEQGLVTNAAKLTELLARVEKLEAEAEKQKEEARKELAEKIEAISTPVKISDKILVNQYLLELERLGEWPVKENLKEKLEGYLTAIAARQQLVEGLDQDIWDGIDPLRISQDDEKTVRQLMERYSTLRIEEQELLTNRQSLLDAADVLRALEDEVIPARVFQNLMATKETFTYRGVLANGSGYTLTYDGSSVQAVRDVKAGVRLQEGDQTVKGSAAQIVFAQDGSMNGSVTLRAKSGVSDGRYQLYWLNPGRLTIQSAKTAAAASGTIEMKVSMGGCYWLSDEVLRLDKTYGDGSIAGAVPGFAESGSTETGKRSGSSSKTSADSTKTSAGSTGNSTAGGNSQKAESASSSGHSEQSLVKAEQSGIISEKELKEIKDKEINLQAEGKLSDTVTYTITIHGKDVRRTEAFSYDIKTTCEHEEDIRALAVSPLILCMEEMDIFPGKLLISLNTELKDDTLLLFCYDAENRQAEYVKKVTVKDGKTAFTLEKGGDYFIAKRALAGSLDDEDTKGEQAVIKEETDEFGTPTHWDETEETVVTGTQEERSNLKYGVLAGVLAAAAAVYGVILYRKKRGQKK